jgi:NAD+ kinase
MMAKPRLILFADSKRPNAVSAMERFLDFAKDKAEVLANCLGQECSIDTLRHADFAIVFGGDGTILGAARLLCESKVPVIGVNVGKLGFLAEFGVEELESYFERICQDKSLIEQRVVLRCQVYRGEERIISGNAVNDVVISAGEPFNMIEFKMEVNGQPLTSCFGDGVILSTPTGSTAYNLSAGGPILTANLSAIVITPICPHSLSFRPIVIDDGSRVQIRPMRVNAQTTLLFDGQKQHSLTVQDRVVVEKHDGKFLVVSNPARTQWDTLADKLKWAEKPRYRQGELS